MESLYCGRILRLIQYCHFYITYSFFLRPVYLYTNNENRPKGVALIASQLTAHIHTAIISDN